MEVTLIPVTTTEDINTLAALAKGIWEEHFTPIIGAGQVAYMLEKFQSVPAIAEQLQNGYRYFFIAKEGEPIGYTGIKAENGKLFLSKLYLRKDARGNGYASQVFALLEELCKAEGLSAVWLTANRYNYGAIAVYKKKGFETIRTQVADIGGGYVMDDYIMEKAIGGGADAV